MEPRKSSIAAGTALVLVAFAANSVLCRMALRPVAAGAGIVGEPAIGPLAFTGVRLLSGAFALAPLWAGGWGVALRRPNARALGAAAALTVYALGFSLAYLELDTGTGALLLFGLVQGTMLGAGVAQGERLGPRRLLGLAAAAAGVVVLVSPGVSAPAPGAAALMAVAGVAWGAYSLLGRGASSPGRDTARNFALALPVGLVLLALAPQLDASPISSRGLVLAIVSGALTSGLGYLLWYAVLPHLPVATASIAQLLVPILAALAGVAFLGEPATSRLVLAGALTLGGVALATLRGAPNEEERV